MPTLTADAVLRAAADELDRNPGLWGRNFWLDPDTGCRCSGGLISYVIAPGEVDADPHRLSDLEQRALAVTAVALFEAHIEPELYDRLSPDGIGGEPLIGMWNDYIATGPQHVAATMRAAAGPAS